MFLNRFSEFKDVLHLSWVSYYIWEGSTVCLSHSKDTCTCTWAHCWGCWRGSRFYRCLKAVTMNMGRFVWCFVDVGGGFACLEVLVMCEDVLEDHWRCYEWRVSLEVLTVGTSLGHIWQGSRCVGESYGCLGRLRSCVLGACVGVLKRFWMFKGSFLHPWEVLGIWRGRMWLLGYSVFLAEFVVVSKLGCMGVWGGSWSLIVDFRAF